MDRWTEIGLDGWLQLRAERPKRSFLQKLNLFPLLDGWMDGWMNKWMDGLMDGRIDEKNAWSQSGAERPNRLFSRIGHARIVVRWMDEWMAR